MSSLLIQNGQLVAEQGIQTCDLLIEDGIIKNIQRSTESPGESIIDASQLLIFPGFIDCHVHFREPGNPAAEDMESGSMSALCGGVTTVCEMPNTNPPTSSAEALQYKRDRAQHILKSQISCLTSTAHGPDIRFFFNVMNEDHLKELTKIDPNTICGVKVYFDHSTGDRKVEQGILNDLFSYCAARDIIIVGHCEDAKMNESATKSCTRNDIAAHSLIRPPESEAASIESAINLAKKHGTRFHVAHLSTAPGVALVRQAKEDGLPVSCEATPHHLFLTVDDYEHLGTFGKMNPPLRTRDHSEALWRGIEEGTIDCIATDHAPHTMEAKKKQPPLTAPSGVPGTETMLPLLLSCMKDGPTDNRGDHRYFGLHLTPQDILRLCHTSPNRVFKLGKPTLETGKPTDICLVNPLEKQTICGKDLHSRCGWTPYEGWEVTGKVVRVIR